MFESFSQSMGLAKQSFSVLMKDKELLVFPFLSGIISILILVSFLGLWIFSGGQNENQILAYALFFIFYFVTYFVVIFFNTALIGAALIRLSGKDPTISDGLRIAFSKLGGITVWSIISATVGLILSTIGRKARGNFLASIVVGLFGASWAIATFFVIPVMVVENKSPFSSIKRSLEIIQQKWGTAIVGRIGIGFIFGLAAVLAAIVLFALFLAAPTLGLAWFALGLFIFVVIGVASSAVNGVYVAALYHYATLGQTGLGFDASSLQKGFR